LFFEITDAAVELTFPWTTAVRAELTHDLAAAALRVIRAQWPAIRDIRMERQLLPDPVDIDALTAAGLECHWRARMLLELRPWSATPRVPDGYRLAPWDIRELDAAAKVIHLANRGALDTRLYHAFFGGSAEECRRGLLSLLAGRYGPLHPRATRLAFHGGEVVGVNIVITTDTDVAGIIELSVTPAHQGRGVGRALLIDSLQTLQADRYERAELAVTAANVGAVRLYESLGFSVSGRFAVCIASPSSGNGVYS
jgi:ribosomal protein S18 acetylase RimI-like enzyme